MSNSISHSVPVLKALWRLVQRGAAIEVAALARESALSEAAVQRQLRALDAAELVDWSHRRLTLAGLALAVASLGRRRAALPTVMLPVVSCCAPHPANVVDLADEARV
jgi:DNA-binding IclR family transcriptional regulator